MTKTYAAFAIAAIMSLSFAAHADAATRKYDPEASMAYGSQVTAPFVRRAVHRLLEQQELFRKFRDRVCASWAESAFSESGLLMRRD